MVVLEVIGGWLFNRLLLGGCFRGDLVGDCFRDYWLVVVLKVISW